MHKYKKVLWMELLKQKILNIDELEQLNNLLSVNTNIKDSLNIISNSNNRWIIENIICKLHEGIPINQSLLLYVPKNISDYLKTFNQYMSFKEALNLSISFYKRSSNNEKNIIKSLSYPLTLLFISLTGLYLFDLYGLDKIFSLLESMSSNYSDLILKRKLIRLLISGSYFISILISLLLYFFTKDKRIKILYVLLNQIRKDNILNTYYTNEYIGLYSICVDLGYKSKNTIDILNSLKTRPIVSFMSYILKEKLEDGDSLLQAFTNKYFDSKLLEYIKIGTYTNSFNISLHNYLDYSKNIIDKQIKRITLIIQLITYGLIGTIIIFMYQVLFLPMQLINAY